MPALLEARPQAASQREDGEFLDTGYRAVFAEHTNRVGTKFGPADMQKICDNCNERITARGAFTPIVVRHTTDDGSNDPEVIGMAGPFRCGKLPDGTSAVFARWRLYREHADKLKKYPRVSVEFWAERKSPSEGYFDPISVLGAETPELDLPLHYAKRGGRQMIRYQAAAPGGSNTFVPSLDDKPNRYQDGSLNPADVQQIVAALTPVIQQCVKAEVASLNPPGGQPDDLNPLNALDGLDDGSGGGDELDEALATLDEGDGEDAGLDGELGDDLGDESAEPFSADGGEAPGDEDDDSDLEAPGNDDDTDSELEDAGPPAEVSDKSEGKKPKKKPAKYSADGRDLEPSEEPEMATETHQQQLVRYQKENTDYRKQVADLTAERDELKTKYQKEVDSRRTAETDLVALRERVEKIEVSERRAVRYQKLSAFTSTGYTFDLEEELNDCASMTDEQFEKHTERIRTKYEKVPMPGINTKPLPVPATGRIEKDAQDASAKRERYSKLAMKNCLAAQNRGETMEFKAEFERILAEDPESKKTAA